MGLRRRDSAPAGKGARNPSTAPEAVDNRDLASAGIPAGTASAAAAALSRSATFGRIPVLDVEPVVAGGLRNAKAAVGEYLPIRATVFREGHDAVAAEVVVLDPQGREIQRIRMQPTNEVDRLEAWVCLFDAGHYSFRIDAFSDVVTTVMHRADVKIAAGVDVELEFTEASLMLTQAAGGASDGDARILRRASADIRDTNTPVSERLHELRNPLILAALRADPIREFITAVGPFPLLVERQRALFGSWYEFFPRSEGAVQNADGSWQSGTFITAAQRLPAVAAMGFDVVYLPPIHPIGMTNRKGRNNSLEPSPHDPGSPWAIGAAAGGHDAIHPDLGTLEDFRSFVKRATELGLEIALDLALQASPDHPWAAQHPEWFNVRADGTIAYAENPPKKYQDIYPINFDKDPEGIYAEVFRVVRHWIAQGVHIFRVDNPHTKPLAFWERLIAEVNTESPDVAFLAEAFTKPPMMRALGEAGFQQSYTYFTWRNDKAGLTDYMRELSGPAAAYMRPNFFVNTPDILPEYLQHGGPAAFAIRAALGALLSPTWGIYAGFELFENAAVRPGSEEYLNSEKYEYRPRNWDAAEPDGTTLAPYITALNRIRREHPAMQQLRTLHFHVIDSPDAVCLSKRGGNDVVLAIVATTPDTVIDTWVHLDMPALGCDWGSHLEATNLLTGELLLLEEHTHIRLDSSQDAALILGLTARANSV